MPDTAYLKSPFPSVPCSDGKRKPRRSGAEAWGYPFRVRELLLIALLAALLTTLAGLLGLLVGLLLAAALLAALAGLVVLALLARIALTAALLSLIAHRAFFLVLLAHRKLPKIGWS
jgi:hypothetical protein